MKATAFYFMAALATFTHAQQPTPAERIAA